MSSAAAVPVATPHTASRLRTATQILGLSLAMTASAGIVAGALFQLLDVRFMWLFVILRWVVFALLLLAPIAARAIPALPMPRLLRTPLAALAICVESIAIDIISAQLH